MLFDALVRVVDAHLPEARPFLHDAKLFDLPIRPHEALPKDYTEEQRDFLTEHFFLPFNAVAVEDRASCIVLVDTEREQRGIGGRRYFIECMPVHDFDPTAWRPEDQEALRASAQRDVHLPPGAVMVLSGYIEQVQLTLDGFRFTGDVGASLLATPQEVLLSLDSERARTRRYLQSVDQAMRARGATRVAEEQRAREATLKNVCMALQEVMLLNTPERFIVEHLSPGAQKRLMRQQARKRRRQDPSTRAVAHSGERPIYVLLTPKEIRERFNFPTPAGVPKRAHERRRHLRTYPDDSARWPKMHGKTVVVRAAWVGPSEVKRQGHKYRVVLEV